MKTITPLKWLPAREVVGGEAAEFTPWLAHNLDLLGTSLGLTDLVLERTEQQVQGKSLDILATGVDQDGSEFPVCIENQYGETDHRHLGQLVTYLAQYEKGYAVWVTEDVHPAHAAAVGFLNRTSPDEIGYFLIQVRFTHGSDGSYQVYFELVEKPNIYSKPSAARSVGGQRDINIQQREYLETVFNSVSPSLASAGYTNIRMHTRGSYIEARVPLPELDEWGARFKIYTTRHQAAVRFHFYDFGDREHNAAAIEVIRKEYEATWASHLPDLPDYEWHGGSAKSDFFAVSLPGQGYDGGNAQVVAEWAGHIATVWLAAMRESPITHFSERVEEAVQGSAAD